MYLSREYGVTDAEIDNTRNANPLQIAYLLP